MQVIEKHKRYYGINTSETISQPLTSSLARRQDLIAMHKWFQKLQLLDGLPQHDFTHYNRKTWEWAYIAQALFERGMLVDNTCGIGFAVGSEPLSALFAKHGATILATDLDDTNSQASIWKSGNQHASNLATLEHPAICEKDIFYKNVSFKPINMNEIPPVSEIGEFDFCWSSCAFEHIGSEQQGMDFLLNTLKLLKPGGVSVHTTEYNLSSNKTAITEWGNVFGQDFFKDLFKEVTSRGYSIAPLDYRLGIHPDEDYVYNWEGNKSHFKLKLGESVATSIGIIIEKTKENQV